METKIKKINWSILFKAFALVFLTALIGSYFTSINVSSEWYESIKPEITPPSYIFPIVWNFLYLTIIVSLYGAWSRVDKLKKNKLLILFGINFLLNIAWSYFYFALMMPAVALLVLIALWLSIISIIIYTKKINTYSAYILVPYILWITFAGYLNYLSI